MSPIPLGFWATAGAGGAAAGSYELISTAYGDGSSVNVTFSSVPSIYKHLQLRVTTRTNAGGFYNDWLRMRFNGVTTNSYSGHNLFGNGSSVSSNSDLNRSSMQDIARVAGNLATTGVYGATVIDILDYASTTKNKTVRVFGGYHEDTSSNYYVNLSSAFYMSTDAVSSISLLSLVSNAGAGYFTTGSRFSLYGIRG